MRDDSFQRAVEKARRAYSPKDWTTIPPHERTEAIYRELRRLDADRAARKVGPKQRPAQRVAREQPHIVATGAD